MKKGDTSLQLCVVNELLKMTFWDGIQERSDTTQAFIKNSQFQVIELRQPQAWEPQAVWICMVTLNPGNKVEAYWKGQGRCRIQIRRGGRQGEVTPIQRCLPVPSSHAGPESIEFQLGMSLRFLLSIRKPDNPWNLGQNTWDIFWVREQPVKLHSR